jgi:hypothetical protein
VFHERTLWPEYLALSEELNTHLHDLTTRVIREAIDDDVSEPTEQPSTKALPRRQATTLVKSPQDRRRRWITE